MTSNRMMFFQESSLHWAELVEWIVFTYVQPLGFCLGDVRFPLDSLSHWVLTYRLEWFLEDCGQNQWFENNQLIRQSWCVSVGAGVDVCMWMCDVIIATLHPSAVTTRSETHLPPLCPQAKDSDDDEEVVQVDRDHFMDEFFEQVRRHNTHVNLLRGPKGPPEQSHTSAELKQPGITKPAEYLKVSQILWS